MFKTHRTMLLLAFALAGCTVHPVGERQERALSDNAGAAYQQPVDKRELPALAPDASPDQLVAYALLSSGDIEQAYWQWRSALEQVPQEGTQKANVMLSYSAMISNGETALEMNTLGLGNDTMNNIMLPDKLRTAATAALDNARAAGIRFDKARFELRAKVLAACGDYAQSAENIRLDQANIDLLDLIQRLTQSRLSTGAAAQADVLRASNERDMAKNELAAEQAKLPQELAAINALMNRPADAPLAPPAALPKLQALPGDGADLLALAAKNNPELQALAAEAASKRISVIRAKQDYWPDFSINATSDLAGTTQSLMGSLALPYLRYQALDAAIRQARADLHASVAMRRQTASDLSARVMSDLAQIHDADRQIDLFENTLLPRAREIVAGLQRTYTAGQSSMLDLLDAQRSQIALRRMLADLRTTREKQRADLEAAAGLGMARRATDTVGN